MLSYYFHPKYSGSAVQAHNLSRHLVSLGIAPHVVSANLTSSPAEDDHGGIPVFRLPVRGKGQVAIVSFWAGLARFLFKRRRSIDIIHAHGTLQHGIASLMGRLLGKPTILKIAMANSDIAFEKQGRIWGRINRALVSRFDCYIATSDQAYRECLDQGFHKDRVHLRPNGVDTDVFRPAESTEEKLRLRAALGLPADRPVICFVGIVHPRKNVDGILRVWKEVQRQGGRAQVVIIGPISKGPDGTPGEYFRQLQSYAAAEGIEQSITFAGQQTAIPDYLRASDIFIFLSRREGMPNVLLEAMSSGLACVASNIGGSTDLISHGETGYLFDVDDTPAQAAALKGLIDAPERARKMGAAAREAIVRKFSLAETARWYTQLYAKLLERDRPASRA